MFNQTTPQDYLNDMHAINLPRIFHPKMKPRDRAVGIRKAKQELGRLKVELQHHRDTLRAKNKKAPSDEVKRNLAPYNLLQNLLVQLTGEVEDLEEKLAAGKMLPQGFEFGRYIFGVEEIGEWFLGGQDQYDEWLEAEEVKQRLNSFKKDGQPHRDKLAQIHDEFAQLKTAYQSAQKKLDKRHKRGYILRRMALLFVLMIVSGGVGAYVYVEMANPLGLGGFGLASFFFLLMPFGYMDWKKRNTKLIAFVREQKTQMRRLQLEGKETQKRYRPIEYQIKALESQYQSLRADLVGGQAISVA
jgi:hypothetical protein